MTFGTPAALWWLVLVPVVVLLYMLRARREPRPVPSVMLWERATRDLVARLPMRRLERNLLLLLQVLTIAVIVLALARPSVALRGFAGDAVALVIDASASMQATDVAPTRLVAAQQAAAALLERLGPRQPIAVVVAGLRPRLIAEFTTDRAALASAVRAIQASDAASALDGAVTLAASLRASGRPAAVHVFGDRAPSDSTVTWHAVGRGAPNAGITAAQTRLDARGHTQLMVRVEAFGETSTRSVAVSMEGRTLASREVRLVPGTPQVALFDLARTSGVAEVMLRGRDALAADDRAVVAVGREGQPTILVVGDPNPVIDAVFRALPAAEVIRRAEVAPDHWGRAALVVLDRVAPLALPPGVYLLVGTIGTNLPVQIEGTAAQQTIRAVSTTHPVTRLVDLRGARVADALAIRPQGGVVLVEGDVPLVWAYEGRGLRVVVLLFDPLASDLPVHPAFPVLIANAVDWLAGSPQAQLGDAPAIAAGTWSRATLLDPHGGSTEVAAQDGVFVLPPMDRVGVYRLRTVGWERRWVVSTADPRESSLAIEPAAAAKPAGPPLPQLAQVRLTPWLLGLAVVLIAGEWWLWVRTLPRRSHQKGVP